MSAVPNTSGYLFRFAVFFFHQIRSCLVIGTTRNKKHRKMFNFNIFLGICYGYYKLISWDAWNHAKEVSSIGSPRAEKTSKCVSALYDPIELISFAFFSIIYRHRFRVQTTYKSEKTNIPHFWGWPYFGRLSYDRKKNCRNGERGGTYKMTEDDQSGLLRLGTPTLKARHNLTWVDKTETQFQI